MDLPLALAEVRQRFLTFGPGHMRIYQKQATRSIKSIARSIQISHNILDVNVEHTCNVLEFCFIFARN